MTPDERKLITQWGIYVAVQLCLADGSCRFSDVISMLTQLQVIHPLEGKITSTWVLDVFQQGPFVRVGHDGEFKLEKGAEPRGFTEPKTKPNRVKTQ